MAATLALLNLGAGEVALVLLLLLLLFGAERLPQLARALGKAKGQLERAQGQMRDAMQSEEARALDAQLAFERRREAHVAQTDEALTALRRAAEELGVPWEGKDAATLRRDIGARVGVVAQQRRREAAAEGRGGLGGDAGRASSEEDADARQ